jgi:homoaconitase/3-isopropylmalate dehydratase large subunit
VTRAAEAEGLHEVCASSSNRNFIGRRWPEGARRQLTSGTWNATGVLLEAGDAIEQAAGRLPYIAGY